MKFELRSALLIAGIATIAGLFGGTAAGGGTGGPTALSSGIDRSAFDPSVGPGQDFFRYVNGSWVERNPIPPDQTDWGAFQLLTEQNLAWLREIVESIGPGETGDGDRQRIRDFYRTATDEAQLERLGASPLRGEFDRIDAIASANDLIAAIAHHHRIGVGTLFEFYIAPDSKDSTRYAAHLYQGGLGLPEREYYLGDDADSKRIRGEYRGHVAKLFELLGDAPAAAEAGADAVLRIETELAKASRTPVQNRDVEAQYNKRTVDQLGALAPGVDWPAYFKAVGAPTGLPYVIVCQPEFFTEAGRLLGSVPVGEWRTYLRWRLIHSTAAYLSGPFERENFRFYRGVLSGAKEMQPRWKRAIWVIDDVMGQPLGRLYVERHFPPGARARIDALVTNLIAACDERIGTRDWMDDRTKAQARAKLTVLMRKVGYPDKWRDYAGLTIRTDSFVQNVLRAREFEFDYWRGKVGGAVDRREWQMTPPTVNAYYDPTLNEIVFPAGILQPPMFDAGADDAANYGAIGAVIGHELTHGFDDQGCLYDAAGNLRNWWTPQDKVNFDARAARLVEQFGACVAVDDLHVNGKLTLGENIADLGGLTIAYAAYQKSLAGREAPVIDGLTGPQRFFMGWAQAWRGSTRPETRRLRLRVDPHSPRQFRVNVPLSNLQQFYDAFGVGPRDPMYRPTDRRVQVW